jgi:hypothetical protein
MSWVMLAALALAAIRPSALAAAPDGGPGPAVPAGVELPLEAVPRGPQSPGTRRMSAWLQRWNRETGRRNPFANAERVQQFRDRIPTLAEGLPRQNAMVELAVQLLNGGLPEESLQTLSNVWRSVEASKASLPTSTVRDLMRLTGLASLRLGEQENCLQHHNPDSCLIPIQGGGRHGVTRGAEQATAIFLELAARDRTDLASRWLLNIGAMTLGLYPQELPGPLVIPPSVFASEYPLAKFPEIATQVGLAVDDIAGGTVAEDFDGDGLVDVMLSSWNPVGQLRYFRNLGNGHFEDRTEAAGLIGVTGGLNLMQADYNNDGWPDVYLVRGAWLGELGNLPDSLLRNNGDGTFSDVTEEAGLCALEPALSAVWFDANNDGWVDLFVGNETQAGSTNRHPCQFFLNQRNGTFRECGAEAGIALVSFVRGVTAGDYDNDGWPDIYISCMGEPNVLFHNDGAAGAGRRPGVHFSDVTPRARVAEPLYSFPTWFWDYDNDGWLDLYAGGYFTNYNNADLNQYVADKLGLPSSVDRPRLFHNRRDGTFEDVTREAGLHRVLPAMSANFGDLDNDGFLDFYLGTGAPSFASLMPNEMFRSDRGKRFQNVTTSGGFGHLQKGHALAFVDLNNDGQQDVLINMGGAYLGDNCFDALFANPGHTNHWVGLKLQGHASNRSAIGVRLTAHAAAGTNAWKVCRVVGSGGSFGSGPLLQELGLGGAERLEGIESGGPQRGAPIC